MSMTTAQTIQQFYQNILQRNAEQAGLDYWVQQADSGAMTLDQIEATIVNSAESLNNVHPIATLYQALFGRVADAGGLSYWANQLASGVSLQTIIGHFLASAEGQAVLGDQGSVVSENFVEHVYANVLGRAAEAGALNFWTHSGMTQAQVVIAIMESAEAQARIGDDIDNFLTAAGQGTAHYTGPLAADEVVVNLHLGQNTYAGAISGDTTFIAAPETGSSGIPANTIQNATVIDGSGHGNVLEIQAVANAGNPTGFLIAPTISGVETLQFVNSANGGSTAVFGLDLAHTTGATELDVINSGNSQFELLNATQLTTVTMQNSGGATVALSDPPAAGLQVTTASITDSGATANSNTSLTLDGEGASALTLNVANSPQGGGNFTQVSVTAFSATQGVTDLTLNLTSSAGATAATPDTLDLDVSGGPALAHLTINSVGHEDVDIAPFLGVTNNDVAAAAALVVTGSGSLDLTDNGLNHFTGLTSFDATGFTGSLHVAAGGDATLGSITTGDGADTVDLSGEASPGAAFTVHTGAGDDAVLLGSGATTNGSFDGGTGVNTIGITDGATTTGGDTFANFQHLEIGPSANPGVGNEAGLAGGSGIYDLANLPGVIDVNVHAIDANSSLGGDVTLNNVGNGVELNLVASGATTPATGGEGEISGTPWTDGGHVITVNMATAGDGLVVNLDAASTANLDSEGNPQTAVGGVVVSSLVTDAGSVTINSEAVGTGTPAAADFNEISALSMPNATSLTINAGLSLFVDQADVTDASLSSIVATGTGMDVDLAYNASAASETGTVLPDVANGISAPLTIVDVSGLAQVAVTEGTTTTLAGGNFHAIFTDTNTTSGLTYLGAPGADLVTLHTLPTGFTSQITGGGSDDYFAIDGGPANFHFAAATDALVNNGAAPEAGEVGEPGGGSEPGEATTMLSSFADPTIAGSTSVPQPAALAEATMESIFGFKDASGAGADTLDFSLLGLTGAVANKAVDFATTDADVAIAGFFSGSGATHGVVVASDSGANTTDVFVFVDAAGTGSFDPLLDPVIHLHNAAGLTAANVHADIIMPV